MAFTIDAEAEKWASTPMKQGKIYRSICLRELISDQDLEKYFTNFPDDVWIAPSAFIETTTLIVYLDKKIIEYETVSLQAVAKSTNSAERVRKRERTIGSERTKTTDSFIVDRVSHVG